MAQRKTLVRGGTGLRISSAPRRLHFCNRDRAEVRICVRVASPWPGRVLVAGGRTLDAEKGKPVPVGAGDGVGNGGQGLVDPSVPLESLPQRCDSMGGVLPLPDHLRARLNAAAARY